MEKTKDSKSNSTADQNELSGPSEPRKGQSETAISRDQFRRRFYERFQDPNFDSVKESLAAVENVAWENYSNHRKAPRTAAAGAGFVNPSYELSEDWHRQHLRLKSLQAEWRDNSSPRKILLISGSPRNEHTCPGEMPKSLRLIRSAEDVFKSAGFETDFLDLSLQTAEFGKVIYPCKACVSTAMPLCHWPCSCFPHHSLGQVNDWMEEIYARWVSAHGVMLISPVHWYQAPGVLKVMMDRLVCADGGNPDPTSTLGKTAKLAKEMELRGWDYPKHLAGRAFSVVAHGDTIGAETLRRQLVDWLNDLGLISAGPRGELDRYIGYWEAYAKNHLDLDQAPEVFDEVNAAAKSLVAKVCELQKISPDSLLRTTGSEIQSPRLK